ncbi:Gfo/Idh/MocA family protein [Secundilactobacillus collinoides]|uniref:Oxidoreductase, NAD-binding domain protein n=2 Tax=Secundilactobacillus collinoides TaxID=33960 RepID=A0A0R2B6T9_SECCO|nr:Gfo/Idh/MocA family oxidoreductase [Secundilactobacillus collinoides]KRM74613.1 oxidoreductase, NAD-binding domain protein [Secundilactobacillus collinoides DSM 20515 = JCM 1123]KZL41447.1 oxidoreductase [Secundilactobacillus collinoides]
MIKFGIIGTNWITQQFVDAARASGDYQLTAVYSRKQATAKAFGEPNGATQFYESLDNFFTDGDFDTVYIASPNSLHYQQTVQAIKADKNVIIEKPAFATQAQMTTVQGLLAEKPALHYFEAARNIHTPNFVAIAKQVAAMPTVQGGNFTYMKYSSRYDKVLAGEEPNVFSLKFAGGALQDLGVYPVYDAVALFGLPQEVAYFPQRIQTGVDGKGVAILRYDDFDVTLNFGKTTNSHMPSEIYGLKDTVVIDDAGELTHASYFDVDGHETVISTPVTDNPMLPEVRDFARVLNDPEAPANQADYKRWLDLSLQVNKVLYNLRQNGGIVFADEPND